MSSLRAKSRESSPKFRKKTNKELKNQWKNRQPEKPKWRPELKHARQRCTEFQVSIEDFSTKLNERRNLIVTKSTQLNQKSISTVGSTFTSFSFIFQTNNCFPAWHWHCERATIISAKLTFFHPKIMLRIFITISSHSSMPVVLFCQNDAKMPVNLDYYLPIIIQYSLMLLCARRRRRQRRRMNMNIMILTNLINE